ncbi:hypothetical protein [Herbidospora daliensis]|uniref:hypothetical protein n=1 Tax=Herbidospora daliensis TaxID=295585 RepID=UPI000784B943|nr:hypothetical protein [Herbidospora daliensis]
MNQRPWTGIAVSALSVVVMAGVGVALWDSLPDLVVTRDPTPQRAGSAVPKFVAVAATPGVLLVIAAVMVASTKLGNRLKPHVDPRLVASPDAQVRTMNVLFTLLPLFLIVVHTGFLLTAAGHGFPLERAAAVGFGVLLMGLGNVLPKIAPSAVGGDDALGRWTLAWQRSQRWGGAAMVVLGAVCAVAAFWVPPMLAAVGAAALIAVVFGVMLLRAAARLR